MNKKMRVWWIPQVPMKSFKVEVKTIEEAIKVMDILAFYDIFQFENKVKGDYSNIGGVEIFEDGKWSDWYDEETGIDDPNEYITEKEMSTHKNITHKYDNKSGEMTLR